MILFENTYAQIAYYSDAHTIRLTWYKYTPSSEYREVIDTYYRLKKQHKTYKSLFDCRKLPMISMEDQQWTAQRAKQELPTVDKPRTAVILSRNLYTKISIENVVVELSDHPDYPQIDRFLRYFDDEETAWDWLQLQIAEVPVTEKIDPR